MQHSPKTVYDILQHNKIYQSDSRQGTGMFHLGQRNEKQNMVKERLSQPMETTTQSRHHVNQINKIQTIFNYSRRTQKKT